jgi:hypothetical protein
MPIAGDQEPGAKGAGLPERFRAVRRERQGGESTS